MRHAYVNRLTIFSGVLIVVACVIFAAIRN